MLKKRQSLRKRTRKTIDVANEDEDDEEDEERMRSVMTKVGEDADCLAEKDKKTRLPQHRRRRRDPTPRQQQRRRRT